MICKLVRAFLLALLLLLLLPTITKDAYQAEITVYEGNYEEETCGIDYSPTTEAEIREVIQLVFREDAEWALRICNCESGFDPSAANPDSSARGLFQYLSSTWSGNWNPYRAYHRENALMSILATKLAYDNGKQSWWSECGGNE